MCRRRLDNQAGFTLTELVVVMALVMAVAAITVPRFSDLVASQRARNAARMVERELQKARLKAVTASRAMRVRLNCPAAGELRMVEFTGVPATDGASNRCDEGAFPFPGPNDTLRSTPSLDGALVRLPLGSAIAGTILTFEFSPRGEVSAVDATGAVTPLASVATLTVSRSGWSNGISINARGRIKVN